MFAARRILFLAILALILTPPLLFAAGPPAPVQHADTASHVVFLGTGAADINRPKTDGCANCTHIREHGGKNARRYSSLFVAPDIVIDFTTTGLESLKASGVAPSAVAHVLITHSHGDHFDPASISALAKEKGGRITLHGNARVVAAMRKHLDALEDKPDVMVHELKPFQGCDVDEWRCIPLPASHAPGEDALLYVLRRKDRALLYATDTSWLPAATFNALKSEHLDLAIVEATFGEIDKPELLTAHMNLPFVRLVRRFLFEQKVMKAGGRFSVTHTSLHWCEPHDILAPKLANEGMILPHDGMRLGL
ncbi:MAG TPA: MBL fold metallo-hydrolase [Verrucomicrobiae bacterium]|nr:MBL fold metallo-hydrolase [Verrucomicrobiae bacterium]